MSEYGKILSIRLDGIESQYRTSLPLPRTNWESHTTLGVDPSHKQYKEKDHGVTRSLTWTCSHIHNFINLYLKLRTCTYKPNIFVYIFYKHIWSLIKETVKIRSVMRFYFRFIFQLIDLLT